MSKILTAYFYVSENGKRPVREWLLQLTPEEKKAIGEDIKAVEYGWPKGMPLCKNLGDGLWEVRTDLNKKIFRVFFCIDEGLMYLLHGIVKKSQKTPKEALEIAKKRKRRLYHGC